MQSTLTDAAVLNDQRQVLTRDRSGAASVWDVTTGAVTELRPRTKSLADDLATLWLPAVVAPWFTVKIVSGDPWSLVPCMALLYCVLSLFR
jgi:hypothetical protein